MDDLQQDSLYSRRILVVEDEYTIAAELARSLEELGVTVIGPAGNLQDAIELVEQEADGMDGAILDIRVRDEPVYPIAAILVERGIPFVFATGYDELVIPPAYADKPRCLKPTDGATLLNLLREQVADRS
jgi:CheY-like chemotaxis protein